ncbi:MAG: hypothetical protein GF392_04245 [Candidatus Omnitrophica bacterium]|nr:hypothetical protein [Candidatus Omnitrophota bacterium]
MEDQRRYIRIKEHHLLKYKILEDKETLTFVRNISAGGIKFHGKVELEPGKNVDMLINFPPYPKPIDVVAKIIWCTPMKNFDGFDIGAEFIRIDDEARSFIDDKMNEAPEEKRA